MTSFGQLLAVLLLLTSYLTIEAAISEAISEEESVINWSGAHGVPETLQQDGHNLDCRLPFQNIDNRCVMVDTIASGTWTEMKLFCEEIGGQMLKMNSCGLMYYIVQFIKNSGLPESDYWIGMSDLEEEGHFVHLDGTSASMGTPFWFAHSDTGSQEPNGLPEENCVAMGSAYFYFLNDFICERIKNVICEQVN